MSVEVLALVNYYARSGYYRHVQTVCNEVLKKRGTSDPTLVFWRALGMLREVLFRDHKPKLRNKTHVWSDKATAEMAEKLPVSHTQLA